MQLEQRTEITPHFLRPKDRSYIFSSFFPGWVLSCKTEIYKTNVSKFILWVLSRNRIHYTSFIINVWGFRGRLYSFARVNLKLHDPCELLAKNRTAQNSPHLLPWISSVLKLRDAEPSKFLFLRLISWEQRYSNRHLASCEGAKKLHHKSCFYKGAKQLQFTELLNTLDPTEQNQFKWNNFACKSVR